MLWIKGDDISSIIIDGYNLIGIHHKDLETQRNKLIDLLIEYSKRKGHSIVVVFDGWKGGSSTESCLTRCGVKIIYSRLGEKADSVIKRVVSNDRREWIVVTSDRSISSHAWSVGSVPVSSETFLPFIWKTATNSQAEENLEEEESMGSNMPFRGNPKKPSKKERAIKRALSKL